MFLTFVVVAVALGVLFFILREKIDWHSGQLSESSSRFIRIGDTVRVQYSVQARQDRVLAQQDIETFLVCEEVVYYNRGTDRVRKAETLLTVPLQHHRQLLDSGISLDIDMHVPPTAPASLDLRDNNIEWALHVKIDPETGITLNDSFEITVPPVRVGNFEPPPPNVQSWPTELPEPPTPRDEL